MNLVLRLTLYTKINFRCIIVLNVKMIKLYKDKFETIFMTSSRLTFLKEDRTLSIKNFFKIDLHYSQTCVYQSTPSKE